MAVSVIGVGTWQFGGEWGRTFSQSDVDAILDKAAELGVTLIDTAECYGDHLAERLIGDYLARHDRSRWVIATKFGHRFHAFMDRSWHLSPAEVEQQLEDSLRALRVETIDLYQFHSGADDAFQNQELWAMLARHKQAGKVRHLGVSIPGKGSTLQVRQAAHYGAEVLQVVYNRLDRRPETEVFPHATAQHLGILARVPLASGFLTGKYQPAATFPAQDVRSTFDAERTRRLLEEAQHIQRTEVPAGVPISEWALAWCLRHPAVQAVIPGSKDVAQLEANARAVRWMAEQP